AEEQGTHVVVSFDGMGYADTMNYLRKGELPSLEKLKEKSAYAKDFVTVMPSLTAPSHASIATGANPAKTGIVSNQFHSEGEKVKAGQSGFTQTMGVPPIWQAAKEQGKITATVAFPGASPGSEAAATYAVS